MHDHDGSWRDGKAPPAKRRARSKAERRRGAVQLLKILVWLDRPLVLWSGEEPEATFSEALDYRPVTHVIGRRLRRMPVGLYAVQLEHGDSVEDDGENTGCCPVNPAVASCARVTPELVSAATDALRKSRRYPRMLPQLVGDVAAWEETKKRRLRRVAEVSRGLAESGLTGTVGLAAEACGVWIGPDRARPSGQVAESGLLEWMGSLAKDDEASREFAGVVLGRRRLAAAGAVRPWVACGRVLAEWPPEAVVGLAGRIGPGALAGHARQWPRLRAGAVGLAVLELLLEPSSPTTGLDPRAMAALLEAGERAGGEMGRRRRALANLACTIEGAGDTSGRPARLPEAFHADPMLVRIHLKGFGLKGKLPLSPPSFEFLVDLLFGDGDQIWPDERWHDAASVVEWLQTAYPDLDPHSQGQLVATLVGLAGRLTGASGSARFCDDFARWLDGWRMTARPGRDPAAILRTAIACLEVAVSHSGWVPDNIAAAPRLLARYSADGYRVTKRSGDLRSSEVLRLVGRAGVLSAETVQALCGDDLGGMVDTLSRLLDGEVARPRALLEKILRLFPEIGSLDASRKSQVIECVLQLGPALVSDVLSWIGRAGDSVSSWGICKLLADGKEQAEVYRRFLPGEMWVLDTIVAAEADAEPLSNRYCDPSDRSWVLVIAAEWWRAGYQDLGAVVEQLLQSCAEHDLRESGPDVYFIAPRWRGDGRDAALAVALAAGSRERLLRLLQAPSQRRIFRAHPLDGLRSAGEPVGRFLSRCLDRPELLPRVNRVLERLALACLFHLDLGADLAAWHAVPEPPARQEWWLLPPELIAGLEGIRHNRRLAGAEPPLPRAIDAVIHQPQRLSRELEALERLEQGSALSAGAARRLARLRVRLADEGALAVQVLDELRRLVPKHLMLERLSALEAIVDRALQDRWHRLLDFKGPIPADPDWDNAFLFLGSIRENRRLGRRLLSAEARGEHGWRLEHGGNREFLDRMTGKGLDMDAWLEPRRLVVPTPVGRLTAFTEESVLKVLQMGNLFGTCLGAGMEYTYSTIANAAEVNKRVLYLRDRKGRILGRKLVVLGRDGALHGFRSYGAGDDEGRAEHGAVQAWVKIAFDLLCRQISFATGARLPMSFGGTTRDNLVLFSRWYYDGVEPFDWWLDHRDHDELVAAVRNRLANTRCDRPPTLRALIWLGDAAAPVISEATEGGQLSERELGFVARHTLSAQVRGLVAT